MHFDSLTAASAPEASRRFVRGSEKQFGFVPSPVAKAAHAPALLEHLFASFAAFERTSLTPLEREVVALTVAYENECHYCMAMHSAMLTKKGTDDRIVFALRNGTPLEDPALEALRRFARAVLLERGRVPAPIADDFARAGYGAQAALDVVLGVGVYVLSTLSNILSQAELDPAFAPFAWTKPAAR